MTKKIRTLKSGQKIKLQLVDGTYDCIFNKTFILIKNNIRERHIEVMLGENSYSFSVDGIISIDTIENLSYN